MDHPPFSLSKTECQQRLQSHDLRTWLKHHGEKKVSRKYESNEVGRKHYELLMGGLEGMDNPEKELTSILKFAAPESVSPTGKLQFHKDGEIAGRAITNVLHGTKNYNRYKAGLHPVTLLTEQKRKVILHALTSSRRRHKSRGRPRSSSNKLPNLNEAVSSPSGTPQDMLRSSTLSGKSTAADSTTVPAITTANDVDNQSVASTAQRSYTSQSSSLATASQSSKTGVSINRLLGLNTRGSVKSASSSSVLTKESSQVSSIPPIAVTNKNFMPKWEHYDTMRARWMYIQPQVKHLAAQSDIRAPRTNQRYLEVNNEVLNGDLNDISYYESVSSGVKDKSHRILNHTSQLLADRIERESRYYKPNPCVYY